MMGVMLYSYFPTLMAAADTSKKAFVAVASTLAKRSSGQQQLECPNLHMLLLVM